MAEILTGKFLPYITLLIGSLVTFLFMILKEDIIENRSKIKKIIIFIASFLITILPLISGIFGFKYFNAAMFISIGFSLILVSIHTHKIFRWRATVQDKIQMLEGKLQELEEKYKQKQD